MLSNVTPKAADPQIRTALLDAAARLLVEEGPAALTTRRLATEVGTSTMAVYTHFEGMDKLRRALAEEGFRRLAERLDQVEDSDDPVSDVMVMGLAYFTNALANPNLYRFMFADKPEEGLEIGLETFQRLIDGVTRSVEAGRFKGEPEDLARQLWVMTHGIVSLEITGALESEGLGLMAEMGANLMRSFGDDPKAIERSVDKAVGRVPPAFLSPDGE